VVLIDWLTDWLIDWLINLFIQLCLWNLRAKYKVSNDEHQFELKIANVTFQCTQTLLISNNDEQTESVTLMVNKINIFINLLSSFLAMLEIALHIILSLILTNLVQKFCLWFKMTLHRDFVLACMILYVSLYVCTVFVSVYVCWCVWCTVGVKAARWNGIQEQEAALRCKCSGTIHQLQTW